MQSTMLARFTKKYINDIHSNNDELNVTYASYCLTLVWFFLGMFIIFWIISDNDK